MIKKFGRVKNKMLNEQIQIITDYIRQTEHDNFMEFLYDYQSHYQSHIYYNLMVYDCLNGGEIFFNEADLPCKNIEELHEIINNYLLSEVE
jgi:hypothetical protein